MCIRDSYNIVDSIFVAKLSGNALTAVTLAFPLQMLLIAVATGTGDVYKRQIYASVVFFMLLRYNKATCASSYFILWRLYYS